MTGPLRRRPFDRFERWASTRRGSVTTWVAAFALGLAVRVLYIAVQGTFAVFDVSFFADDAAFYVRIARSIAAGDGMSLDGRPTAFVAPGYPLFLAALLRAGADPFAIQVVQAVLGALTAVLAGASALEIERARTAGAPRVSVAFVAGTVAALYPHLVFWTGYLITETLFVFLVASALYLTARALNRRSRALAAAAGLVSGIAALTRPAYLAVGVVIVVWLGARWLATRQTSRTWIAIMFAAGFALPVALWAARNVIELGAPVLTSTESGFVFYAGNSKEGTGGSRGYLDGRDYPALAPPAGASEVEADRFYWRRSVADILEDPATAIRKWPAKLWNMWRPTYEGASARNTAVSLLSYLPVLGLGVLGALLLLRAAPDSAAALPVLFLGPWIALHVVVAGMIRFRLPAELVLIVAGSVALHAFASRGPRLSSAGHALG